MSILSHSGSEAERTWFAAAIFALDGWLRRREQVFEFTAHPECILRIQHDRAERTVALSDGTLIAVGDPVLRLHFWNEQMTPMGEDGPSMAWARRASRAFRTSLVELAKYLDSHPELDRVAAVRADMGVDDEGQSDQLAKIVARQGFESLPLDETDGASARYFAENVLAWLIVRATNPVAARYAVLRRRCLPIYLSRAELERRFLPAARTEASPGGSLDAGR